MKKIIFISFSLLSISLIGCGTDSSDNSKEKNELINYLQENGEIKDNITWLELPCDNKNATPYLIYNSSTDYFGFAYHSTNYTYSEAAKKKIITSETKGYTFFEYGKPWCGTYYYSYRNVSYNTLQETKGIVTYKMSNEAFSAENHHYYSSSEYIKNINIERDDNNNLLTTGKSSLSYWVNEVAKGLNDSYIVHKLPYVF